MPGGVKKCRVVCMVLAYGVGIVLIIISGWIIALVTGWNLPYVLLTDGLEWLRVHSWESLVLGIFFLVLGLLPFFRPRKKPDISFGTATKWGEVRITGEALVDIVSRSAHALPGVRLVQPVIRQREDGLEIILNSQLNPEFIIPETSNELQVRVKEDVEHYTGIKVAEVKVLVRRLENNQTTQPARLR